MPLGSLSSGSLGFQGHLGHGHLVQGQEVIEVTGVRVTIRVTEPSDLSDPDPGDHGHPDFCAMGVCSVCHKAEKSIPNLVPISIALENEHLTGFS